MSSLMDKLKLISDDTIKILNDDYYLTKSNSSNKLFNNGGSWRLGHRDGVEDTEYTILCHYKKNCFTVLGVERIRGLYTVITKDKVARDITSLEVMNLLMDNIDIDRICNEWYSNNYHLDFEFDESPYREPVININCHHDFTIASFSLDYWAEFTMIYNKNGKRIVDFTQGISRNIKSLGDRLLIGMLLGRSKISKMMGYYMYDNTLYNKLKDREADKVLMDIDGNILMTFKWGEKVRLNGYSLIIDNKRILDWNSLKDIHSKVIERETKKHGENLRIYNVGYSVVLCEKGKKLSRIENCTVINLLKNKVYEGVNIYQYGEQYNAIIVESNNKVDIIDTRNGSTTELKGEIDKVYKDSEQVRIIKLKDGIRYRLDKGCVVNLYNNRG